MAQLTPAFPPELLKNRVEANVTEDLTAAGGPGSAKTNQDKTHEKLGETEPCKLNMTTLSRQKGFFPF